MPIWDKSKDTRPKRVRRSIERVLKGDLLFRRMMKNKK